MLLTEYLFNEHTVRLKAEAGSWQEAIKIGTDLLEEKGHITSAYYKDIIKQANDIGPYFVLAPGLAMPHTRPEFGVIESCWALVTLNNPVEFGSEHNDPVDILLTMASKDSKEQNEGAIVQVVEIFDTPELVEAIRNAKNMEELKYAFDNFYVPE